MESGIPKAEITDRYAEVLKNYIASPSENDLFEAEQLGRHMVAANIPPEEIGTMHAQALKRLYEGDSRPPMRHLIGRASMPLVEILMAYGLAFRAQCDAIREAEAEKRKHLLEILRAMRDTVRAMAKTIEMRDPYTAGHQRRVTRLAIATAKEMGLSEDQIEGLRVAGSLHDLGKIYVPAEILNKPSRLTEVEFALIRTHPRVGYEILQGIHFPWPVAQIVHQHHERMDGSGYPSRLSGEDIPLEARVLAVADVVEAMASHRPYRPALGIEPAIQEISTKSGQLYDPDVAAATVKLFTDGTFRFE